MRQPGYDVVWRAGESALRASARERRTSSARRRRRPISVGSRRCCVPSTSSASRNDSTSFSSRSRTSPACDTSRTSNRTRARRIAHLRNRRRRRNRTRRRVPYTTFPNPSPTPSGRRRRWTRGARTRVASDGRTRGATVRRRRGGEEEAEAFRAATREAGGARCAGGFPPKSPHKWIAAADAERLGATRVVPGCFTDETGGGQATAYIFFDPVVLVDAETDATCVKGCTMDPPPGTATAGG